MTKEKELTIRERFHKELNKVFALKEKLQEQKDDLQTEVITLKADVKTLKKQITVLNTKNKKRIEALGWEGITIDEMNWVVNNPDRFKYMRPSLELLRGWIQDDKKIIN